MINTILTTRANNTARQIILEGVDRSGKGTMQLAINEVTRYKHLVQDRGTVGFKAYCRIFNKAPELYEQYEQMEKSQFDNDNVIILYLTADTDELLRRCTETDHEILDFDLHKKIYEEELEKSSYKNIIWCDTTDKSQHDIVRELVEGGIL